MNNPQIYQSDQFGKIRVLYEDGKPLFSGSDVCKALGYSNQRDALTRHCKGVVKRDIPTKGGNQQANFLPEGDVYRLITHSKLPSAEQFERWVFDEVLPSIRQTGQYSTQKQADTYTRYLRVTNSQMAEIIRQLADNKQFLKDCQKKLEDARAQRDDSKALYGEVKNLYGRNCDNVRKWENIVEKAQNTLEENITVLEQYAKDHDVFAPLMDISSDELVALFSPVLNEMTAQAVPTSQ